MPIISPPAQPPVQPPIEQPVNVNNEQQQDQFQDQQQQQDNRIGELLQKQQTESDADSSADSTSVNSSTQSNIQVNNNSNRIEYDSFKIPETTLNINGYVTERGDVGAVVGVNIPLGGKSRGRINRALELRVAADQLAFEQEYSSVCANIEGGGFVVSRNASTLQMLRDCGSNITKTAVVVRNEPVINNNVNIVNQLKQENEQLKVLIAQLAQKIDTMAPPVNGGY